MLHNTGKILANLDFGGEWGCQLLSTLQVWSLCGVLDIKDAMKIIKQNT